CRDSGPPGAAPAGLDAAVPVCLAGPDAAHGQRQDRPGGAAGTETGRRVLRRRRRTGRQRRPRTRRADPMRLVLLPAESLPRSMRELRSAPATAEVAALAPVLTGPLQAETALLDLLESIPVRPPGVKLAHPEQAAYRSRKDEHFA